MDQSHSVGGGSGLRPGDQGEPVSWGGLSENGSLAAGGDAVDIRAAIGFLQSIGQESLAGHLAALEPPQRDALLQQLRRVRWGELRNHYHPPDVSQARTIEVVTLADRRAMAEEIEPVGRAVYARGKAAVLLVAGGQGTRLGYYCPKGCYPIGPISGNSFFQFHCEKVLSMSEETGHAVPLLIMTSPATDGETREFLGKRAFFGLDSEQVWPFRQGMVPTCDPEGRALLSAPGRLVENPNGHGGCIEGLAESGYLERLRSRGVTDIVFIQVDNVLVPVYEPFGVGLRHVRQADTVTKVLRKADAREKIGAMLNVAGRDCVVEYSDLPEELRSPVTPAQADLAAWGRPGAEIYGVEFLSRLVDSGFHLSFHLAPKPVKVWTPEGCREVAGIKRERFVFDVLTEARNVNLEIERGREFAPVKNLTGVDSVESAREMISREYARWLRAAGVEVDLAPGKHVEISPRFASTAEQLAVRLAGLAEGMGRVNESLLLGP